MMKFLRFPLVRMIIGLGMLIASIIVASVLFELAKLLLWPLTPPVRAAEAHAIQQIAINLWLIVVVLCTYFVFVRGVERRPVTELAPRYACPDFVLGVVMGFGLFLSVIGTLWISGVFQFDGTNKVQVLAVPLALSLQSGFNEEIIVRGVMFRILEEWLGTWISLVLTASFFGGLHLLNPNATAMGAIAIACSAGVILAGAYALTRRLWLPIGLHFGWNFMESGIFDLPVSGRTLNGWIKCRLEGPEWLTGGPFGPEASVVVIVLGLAMGAAFFVAAARRGRIVPPPWRRRALAIEPLPLPNGDFPEQFDLGAARKQP